MSDATLVHALQNPSLYEFSIKRFDLIETHISWVILTGKYAYKLKKPVNFEFLDYTSLEKRHFYCQEELRLNRRLAPQIYLEVVPIYGSAKNPSFSDKNEIIEYAVKMREFSQAQLLTAVDQQHHLTPHMILELADIIAKFHENTIVCQSDQVYGNPELVLEPVQQNFDQIKPLLKDVSDNQRLKKLETWANEQYEKLRETFKERKENGYVRECHGDIHLGNIVMLDDKPVIFDCIEFNNEFRWLDVIADFCFLVMDLEQKQHPELAFLLINRYFQRTGDYGGLKILRFYEAYRAVVRAKVALFELSFDESASKNKKLWLERYNTCTSLAESYQKTIKPWIIITYGYSCSGKTSLSRYLSRKLKAIHISSDLERKRLFNLKAEAKTNSAYKQNIYTKAATDKTYQRLMELTQTVVESDYPVIVDATFSEKAHRDQFFALAKKLNIPCVLLQTKVPENTLRQWIKERMKDNREHSEAALHILEEQLKNTEVLTKDEEDKTVVINVDKEPEFNKINWLVPALNNRLA